MLEMVIIETHPNPDSCVIWLHGLGADGHDFSPIVPELNLSESLKVRFLFPHAPMQPVTINNGYVMRAWYDIVAPDLRARQDAEGINRSQQAIESIIKQQLASGMLPQHIVLAGFSQGGAIALHTGLRYGQSLAGIMALSTYLPLRDTVAAEVSAENRQIPIFMAHGNYDQVVPIDAAVTSRRHLTEMGYEVEWYEYPMEHSVSAEEISEIGKWLGKVLA